MCEVCSDAIGYLGGVMLAICTVPELWHMYCTKSAEDLQVKFLVLYLTGISLTFIYLVRKDAWAGWVTMTVEIFLSFTTLAYKIYLDRDVKKNGRALDAISSETSKHLQLSSGTVGVAQDSLRDSIVILDDIELSQFTFSESTSANGCGSTFMFDYGGIQNQDPDVLVQWFQDTFSDVMKAIGRSCVYEKRFILSNGVKGFFLLVGFDNGLSASARYSSSHCVLTVQISVPEEGQDIEALRAFNAAAKMQLNPTKFTGSHITLPPGKTQATATRYQV